MAIDAGLPKLIIYVSHGELANNPIVVGDLTMAISNGVCTYSSASTGTHTELAPLLASQQTDPLLTVQKAAEVARKSPGGAR